MRFLRFYSDTIPGSRTCNARTTAVTTEGSSGRGGQRRRRATSDEAGERQRAIGERLRALFDGVVNEPIPEDFLKLLEEAEGVSAASKDAGSEGARPDDSVDGDAS
jgi:hypothetical protein